jgi:hypothetical protein
MDNQAAIELAITGGDLSDLTTEQRTTYYQQVCESLGLNPLTSPFAYLTLNGKLRLYALRDCTDQLRRLHGISIYIASRERMGDIYVVTARAKDRTGREDESTGAVPLGNLKGDALANALMKAETKAKRRVTLSIAGLGWLDETELATIPGAQSAASDVSPETTTGRSLPLPVGEGTADAATPPQPTAEDITTLVDSARAANVDLEAFGHDMRRLMQLPESQKITKKFLRERMTMAQYNTARAHYGEALRQILEEDVPDHEPPSQAGEASTSTNVSASTTEGTPVPFVESSPAPGPDPDATVREKLRQEALSWYIQPVEIEHILSHHPLEKARNLLWKARRNTPPPTWVPVAAD